MKITEDILNKYQVKNGKYTFPVDLENIAKSEGLTIQYQNDIDYQGSFDAEKKLIIINENEIEERQRFTLAHELGHYFLKHTNEKEVLFRDTNTTLNNTFIFKKEVEANKFAANLLVPAFALEILIDVRGETSFEKMREFFKVSSQCLDIRLKSLGYYD